MEPATNAKTKIRVCVGTSCYLKGAYDVLKAFQDSIKECASSADFDLGATFCLEHCNGGPTVQVNEDVFSQMTPSKARELVQRRAAKGD